MHKRKPDPRKLPFPAKYFPLLPWRQRDFRRKGDFALDKATLAALLGWPLGRLRDWLESQGLHLHNSERVMVALLSEARLDAISKAQRAHATVLDELLRIAHRESWLRWRLVNRIKAAERICLSFQRDPVSGVLVFTGNPADIVAVLGRHRARPFVGDEVLHATPRAGGLHANHD